MHYTKSMFKKLLKFKEQLELMLSEDQSKESPESEKDRFDESHN